MSPAPFINRKLVEIARREDSLIVFPHTQRTGGKTFRDKVLGKAYGADRIYSSSLGTGSKRWPEVTPADLTPFRVFTGASNYAELDKGRPCVFVGLMRHPLYRAVSLYFYCRQREGHRLHAIANRLSLEEFYPEASREYPIYLRNTQCLRICGKPDARRALRTIQARYVGVGFSSDIGGFAATLGDALDWPKMKLEPPPPDEERYGRLITPRFRTQVLEESAEDLKLYEQMSAAKSRPVGVSLAELWDRLKRVAVRQNAPVKTANRSGPGESNESSDVPPSPFDERDKEYFEHKKTNPNVSFAQYFMKPEGERLRRGAHHHSLGKNIDGRGEDNDFWQAGAHKATKYIRTAQVTPQSRVIEYGCGSLRIGAHFIRFLEPGNFFGLDVIEDFYEIGKELIGPQLLQEKAPRFGVIGTEAVAEAEAFQADLVFCSAVCVHVHPSEIASYFHTLTRLCRKPRARLLFDTSLSEAPLRYRHRSWAWPLGFVKKSLGELDLVQVNLGNQRLEGDTKIVLAALEFRRRA